MSMFFKGSASLIPTCDVVLIADSDAGAIFTLNMNTGAQADTIGIPPMASTAGGQVGRHQRREDS